MRTAELGTWAAKPHLPCQPHSTALSFLFIYCSLCPVPPHQRPPQGPGALTSLVRVAVTALAPSGSAVEHPGSTFHKFATLLLKCLCKTRLWSQCVSVSILLRCAKITNSPKSSRFTDSGVLLSLALQCADGKRAGMEEEQWMDFYSTQDRKGIIWMMHTG